MAGPFTDGFTGTVSNSLPGYSSNWVTPTGANTCVISSNNGFTGGTGGGAFNINYWNATFAASHYAKFTMVSGQTASAGVALRSQSGSSDCFWCIWDPPSSLVYAGQFISGTATDWDAGQGGWAAGDIVSFECDASVTTTFYIKRTRSGSTTTIATYTSKNALTGGRAGVMSFTADSVGPDDWEGGDVGGGVAFSPSRNFALLGIG